MKKKLIVLGLAVILVMPVIAGAVVFETGDNVTLDQPINENVYVAGGMVRQSAAVTGDLVIAGGNLYLNASTSEDVLAAGGQIDVTGAIGEDLRLAGGNLTLRAPVGGDAVIAGGQVTLLPEAIIAGDLSIAGGQVTLNNRVNGNVVIRAGEITVGEQAVIVGKLTYYSPEEIVIPAGAQVQGGIEYHPISRPAGGTTAALFGAAAITALIFKLLMLFIAAWILAALLGAAAPRLVALTANNFWSRLGWGFVTLIVAPVLAIILFATVIGIPLGLGVLALYLFLLVIAYIFTVLFTGSWLMRRFNKSELFETNWKAALLGALVLTLLGWIPVIGWIICFLLFLAAFGAVSTFLLGWFRDERAGV